MTGPSGGVGYDALLLLSFGGPEGPEDVRPFLDNVTRGRGVPPERLDEVAEHYLHFGGVSPINALNTALIDRIETELAVRGVDLPVYFGNRNWHPLIEDTVAVMARDGVRRALVLATSAWAGFSGCGQYQDDIARARDAVGAGAPELVRLRQFHDHPLLIAAFADAVRAARADLGDETVRVRLVFTAHSIPVAADAAAGPPQVGAGLYSRQVRETAALVAAAAGWDDHDVAWQSRSGPPQVPWLEPDVCDHIAGLGADVDAVLVCPIGFVSDHLEVIWDLDTEAREVAETRGLGFARAATPGTDPRMAQMVVDLIAEETGRATPLRAGTAPQFGRTVDGARCAPGCCAAVRPRTKG